MSWVNYDDVRQQLEAAGLVLDGGLQIGSSKPVRCKLIDDKREKRGWYRLHELALANGDRLIVGSFGVWRGDENNAQKVELSRAEKQRLDPDQQQAIKARAEADRKRSEAERAAQVERAARRAAAWWAQCKDEGEPAYIKKKGLASRHGARVSPDGNLVIPMHDGQRNVRGLQVIYSDPKVRERKGRDKDYAPPGMSKSGLFYTLGALASGSVALLCEGFATGASLHEATGLPVVIAFDAGNLMPVAQALRKQYRRRMRLLVCADDDYLGTCQACKQYTRVAESACEKCGAEHGKVNTGVLRAQAAALAVDGGLCVPWFAAERPTNRKGPTDFNDLHTHPQGGLAAVAAQVDASMSALGWRVEVVASRQSDIGEAGKARLKGLLSIDEAVNRYSVVYGGNGMLFDHAEHLLVAKSDVLDILPDHGWREWKSHPARRVVRLAEVGFDPTEQDPAIRCNLWAGWPTAPAPDGKGSCERLLELLRYLTGEEQNAPALYEWVLRWLAYPVQHPGAKMKTALIFHGPQGVGKNLFFEAVMQIYGHYGRIVDQAAVEDKFNDWLSRKLFLIADEVVARQELYHIKNKLKGIITGDWIRINPKNLTAHDERNHVNFVFLSNEIQPLVLEKDDRRHVVIWTPPALSKNFYREVDAEIRAGGAAALHRHLLEIDLGDFGPNSPPPETEAKRDLLGLSGDSIEHFLRDWQDGETPHPFCPALSGDLYQAYVSWCRRNGEPRPRTHVQFSGGLRKRSGWVCEPRQSYDDRNCFGVTKARRVVIPPADALQKVGKAHQPGVPVTKWVTECFFDFRDSLSAQ